MNRVRKYVSVVLLSGLLCSNTIDELTFHVKTGELYINNNFFGEQIYDEGNESSNITFLSGWQSLGKDSYRVTWAKGTSAAMVAAALFAYWGTLGPAGVIAAMGTGALSALASHKCTLHP